MAILHFGGADGSGKSTLCKELSKKLNCEVFHFDKPKDLEDGKNQYFNFLSNIETDKDIICDRFHDGEHIYAPLYRGYESNYLTEFESELRKYPYLFINTTTTLDTIKDRLKKRGEDFVKEEHFQTVLNLYKRYISIQSMPYIIIDTSDSNIDQYIQRVLTSLEIIKKLYDYHVKNDCKNIYYGNMEADNFIVVDKKDLEIAKSNLIKYGDYNNYWITTNEDKEFVNYQIELLNPKSIIYYGGNK